MHKSKIAVITMETLSLAVQFVFLRCKMLIKVYNFKLKYPVYSGSCVIIWTFPFTRRWYRSAPTGEPNGNYDQEPQISVLVTFNNNNSKETGLTPGWAVGKRHFPCLQMFNSEFISDKVKCPQTGRSPEGRAAPHIHPHPEKGASAAGCQGGCPPHVHVFALLACYM